MTIAQKIPKSSLYRLEWLSLILLGDIHGTISLRLPLKNLLTIRDWLLIGLLKFWILISAGEPLSLRSRSISVTIMPTVFAGGAMGTLKRGIGWLILKLLLRNTGLVNSKNVILTIGL